MTTSKARAWWCVKTHFVTCVLHTYDIPYMSSWKWKTRKRGCGLRLRTTSHQHVSTGPFLPQHPSEMLLASPPNITPGDFIFWTRAANSAKIEPRTPRTPECADARLSPKLESVPSDCGRFGKRNPTKLCFRTDSSQQQNQDGGGGGFFQKRPQRNNKWIQMELPCIFRSNELLFSCSRLLTHECHLVADGRQIAIQIMHLKAKSASLIPSLYCSMGLAIVRGLGTVESKSQKKWLR